MNLKSSLLLLFVLWYSASMGQTVKHFAGKINIEPDAHLYHNNATCDSVDAYFYNPEGMHWDKKGNMWITEKNKIRLYYNNKFYNRAGYLGDGDMTQSYQNGTGIGGSGTGAGFYKPTAIVSDDNGVLFIVDSENHAIRQMDAFSFTSQQQKVITCAGALPSGNEGVAGTADGSGTNARFDTPKGMVMDANGNMYVTEFWNYTIRKITSGNVVSTLAGKATIQGTKDGVGTGAEFGGPYGIAQLDANWLVVSDHDNYSIRKVHMTTGEVVTICGSANEQNHVDGNFTTARFRNPKGIAVVAGKIYVCDVSIIRVIDLNAKTVSTFAGSMMATGNQDGTGSDARFTNLVGMAYDGKISLYVTDHEYNVIKKVTINDLAPTVDFSASKRTAVVDVDAITLKNQSTGQPATTIKWTISPATYQIASGALSANQLDVKFNATGFYHVTLDIVNAFGVGNSTKNNYISVSTIGIKEVPNSVSFGVFPNPSTGHYTVQSLHGNFPIQVYSISDLTGKVLLSKTCSNTLEESFDLGAFQNGFYILSVKSSTGTRNLKLQKI